MPEILCNKEVSGSICSTSRSRHKENLKRNSIWTGHCRVHRVVLVPAPFTSRWPLVCSNLHLFPSPFSGPQSQCSSGLFPHPPHRTSWVQEETQVSRAFQDILMAIPLSMEYKSGLCTPQAQSHSVVIHGMATSPAWILSS